MDVNTTGPAQLAFLSSNPLQPKTETKHFQKESQDKLFSALKPVAKKNIFDLNEMEITIGLIHTEACKNRYTRFKLPSTILKDQGPRVAGGNLEALAIQTKPNSLVIEGDVGDEESICESLSRL